jgi:DNA-binding transcriptional LysR family regulator
VPDEPLEHRGMALGLLGRHRLNPATYVLPSNEALKRAAQAGLGLALVPERAARLELGLGLLVHVRVRERLPAFDWVLLRPERAPRSEPAERLLAWARGPEARSALERAEQAPRDGARPALALSGAS